MGEGYREFLLVTNNIECAANDALLSESDFKILISEMLDQGEKEFAVFSIELDHAVAGAEKDLSANRAVITGVIVERLARKGFSTICKVQDSQLLLLLRSDSLSLLALAEEAQDVICSPIQVGDTLTVMGATIGVASYDQDLLDPQGYIATANRALHDAKIQRVFVNHYSPATEDQIVSGLAIFRDFQLALNNSDELFLEYQPQVSLESKKTKSVEALIRWRHPTRGLLQPVDFIPLLESTYLVHSITRWVVRRSISECAVWWHQGKHVPVTINVSVRNLETIQLEQIILSELRRSSMPRRSLIVEVTESSALESKKVLLNLNSLKERGIGSFIDDFGTGHASLLYLKSLPSEKVKIDKSFIRNLVDSKSDQAIVEGVVLMCIKLGKKVVAEGVETAEQADLLLELGCELAQGFHFSRPVEAIVLNRFL